MKIDNLPGKIAALAAFGLVCVAIFLYLFKSAGGNIIPGHRYSFTATLQNSFQLVIGLASFLVLTAKPVVPQFFGTA